MIRLDAALLKFATALNVPSSSLSDILCPPLHAVYNTSDQIPLLVQG